jgi:hypothetical protein
VEGYVSFFHSSELSAAVAVVIASSTHLEHRRRHVERRQAEGVGTARTYTPSFFWTSMGRNRG